MSDNSSFGIDLAGVANNSVITAESLEERNIVVPDGYSELNASEAALRRPRTAALLSLLPGLGQLYNGETGKGLLFLAVTAINALSLLYMLCAGPFLRCLGQLAAQFHMGLNADLCKALHITGTLLVIYLGLLAGFVSYAVRDAYDQAIRAQRGTVFARFFLGFPEAASGSYLFHFAVTAACVMVVLFTVIPPVPIEQAVTLELVQPPPPPPPALEKRKPILKQLSPQAPPKQAPQVVQPQPPVVPLAETTEPSPIPIATAPVPTEGAPSGDASASGTNEQTAGGGDPREIDYSAYVAELQRRIKKAWFPPKGDESKTITVKFKVKRGGEVSKIRLVTSSGVSIADAAAIAAVQQSAPFPPLPSGSPEELEIKFTFDYSVFNGGQPPIQNL